MRPCFFLPHTSPHSISPFFFHCSATFHFLSHAYKQIHSDTFSGLPLSSYEQIHSDTFSGLSLFFFSWSVFCKSYSRFIWEGKYSIYLWIKITLTIVEKFYWFIENIVICHLLSDIWSHLFIANRWGNSGRLYFWGAPKSLQMVTATMKLKDAYSLEGKLWPT